MAIFDTTRTTYGAAFAAGRLSNFVSSIVSSVVAWNDARVTRNALTSLSDRELDDIGLTRGDIPAVAETDFFR